MTELGILNHGVSSGKVNLRIGSCNHSSEKNGSRKEIDLKQGVSTPYDSGSAMRSITSWCAVCIPGRKQKETKTEEPEKSSRKKSSRKRSSGPDEGSSHQGTIPAASTDTGGAAVVVMSATQMSAMEGSSHEGGDGGGS
ncbi:hypothetical protein SADUNF_Sadunf09G0028200 [Salix dunnii]|uniref:Uncharacterized protein n=1 Tax=Salix dunnii TaxID=1413687 RepID=A0A835MZK8_9ROSI|nr:hypothetical protein SADUNF_Sadunf09G0028200 [Salix dunnii]